VGALVFKISGRWRRAGCGGFDSHALPPLKWGIMNGECGIATP
jgi:hypothetical protein